MSLTSLTVNAVIYTTYADRTEVNEYLAVDPVRKATWEALADTDDARGIYIVSATRRLNLLNWQGTKTGGDTQVNAWPRTGLTYLDGGSAVSTSEVPQEVEDATALLAGSILITAAVSDIGTSGTNTKKVKAGSAEVEFFRSQVGKPLQDETAYKLIAQWLEAAQTSDSLGPMATGTDGEGTFDDIDAWGRTRGYP